MLYFFVSSVVARLLNRENLRKTDIDELFGKSSGKLFSFLSCSNA